LRQTPETIVDAGPCRKMLGPSAFSILSGALGAVVPRIVELSRELEAAVQHAG
jgi:hypothetical protein